MVSALRSLSSTFANLLWSALGARFFFCFFSGLLCKLGFGIELSTGEQGASLTGVSGTRCSSIRIRSDNVYSSLFLLLLLHPSSPTRHAFLLCFLFLWVHLLPEVSLSQRTQAFLTWLQRFNDWCVQTSISSKDDMHPPPPLLMPSSLLQTSNMSFLLLSATVSLLSVSHLHRVSPAWGGLHKLLPWESQASSLSRTPETQLTVN